MLLVLRDRRGIGRAAVAVVADQNDQSAGVGLGLESGVVQRVVTMDEVLNEELDEYQKDINDSLDI